MASNNTTSVTYCEPSYDYQLFNQISLGPALIIIIVLMFMKRRVKWRLDCCDGRPGIQPPLDSLGSEENRFSYALAYAAMALSVNLLFSNKLEGTRKGPVVTLGGPSWVSVFSDLVSVILLGIIYLPLFLCLSTNAKILGSIMGVCYTAMRFTFLLIVAMRCLLDRSSVFIYYPILVELPGLASHMFLLCRFLVIFVMEVSKKCNKKNSTSDIWCGMEPDFFVNPQYVAHVKTLLQGEPKGNSGERKWYIKGRNFVYTPDPDFKYSVTILATVIVSGIIIYECVIIILGGLVGVFLSLRQGVVDKKRVIVLLEGQESYDETIKFYNIFIVSFVAASIVSALFMYFQMYRMLLAHRNHVIKLMKGYRRFLPRVLSSPEDMVGASLRFCGYQIAYFLWGYIIMLVILVGVVMAISTFVVIFPLLLSPDMKRLLIAIALGLVPPVTMAIFVFLAQKILAAVVFKDRSMNSKVVNIDNRRCYLFISFFFFFFNILVGFMSCMLRILKGMILGILFIGRIDRPLMMKGFTSMDSAYVAYIGFLHLQVAHKHPVVLVFCQILWERIKEKKKEEQTERFVMLAVEPSTNQKTEEEIIRVTTYPRVSVWALNKWFVAVTMIRNPSMILDRKGFLKHFLLGIPQDHIYTNAASSSNEVEKINSKELTEAMKTSHTKTDEEEKVYMV